MHWDYKQQKTVTLPDEPVDGYPGWVSRDCVCCNGIEWSATYEAIECDLCQGAGRYYVHKASGAEANYPGGPFIGRTQPVLAD